MLTTFLQNLTLEKTFENRRTDKRIAEKNRIRWYILQEIKLPVDRFSSFFR